MTWSLPDTYHLAGHGRGTATFKFYEGRDILATCFRHRKKAMGGKPKAMEGKEEFWQNATCR